MENATSGEKNITISWVTLITSATALYYWMTFVFELGFFSRFLPFMSAFSVSDHTMHAAALTIPSFGLMVFLVLFFRAAFGQLNISITDSSGQKVRLTSWLTSKPSVGILHLIPWFAMCFAFVILAGVFFISDGLNLMSFYCLFIVGLIILFIMTLARNVDRETHGKRELVLAVIIGLTVFPLLAGYVFASDALFGKGAKIRDSLGRPVGAAVFIGSDKIMVTSGHSICLVNGEGRMFATAVNGSAFGADGTPDCATLAPPAPKAK